MRFLLLYKFIFRLFCTCPRHTIFNILLLLSLVSSGIIHLSVWHKSSTFWASSSLRSRGNLIDILIMLTIVLRSVFKNFGSCSINISNIPSMSGVVLFPLIVLSLVFWPVSISSVLWLHNNLRICTSCYVVLFIGSFF